MTGYTVHTGSTVKFSSGWDHIFQGRKSKNKSLTATPAEAIKPGKTSKKSAKKAVKKSAVKTSKSSPPGKKKATTKSVKRSK